MTHNDKHKEEAEKLKRKNKKISKTTTKVRMKQKKIYKTHLNK